MPTQAIRREQRDALYREVVLDLTDIGSVMVAIDDGDYALARKLRTRYETQLRLLDDIGWNPNDPGEEFELTMPDTELAQLMLRLGRLRLARILLRMEQLLDQQPDALGDLRESAMAAAACSDVL
jgi:hypothetical protein